MRALLVALATLASSIEAPASQAGGEALLSLDALGPGLWELRNRDEGRVERVCLPPARNVVQLRHRELICSQLVLERTPVSMIVQYTCPGHGFGRTHVRLEGTSLMQIETQGVAEGLPFDMRLEARRVGHCRN